MVQLERMSRPSVIRNGRTGNEAVAGDLWRRARIASTTLNDPQLAARLYKKAFTALKNGRT